MNYKDAKQEFLLLAGSRSYDHPILRLNEFCFLPDSRTSALVSHLFRDRPEAERHPFLEWWQLAQFI
jgi:hypothetical protein